MLKCIASVTTYVWWYIWGNVSLNFRFAIFKDLEWWWKLREFWNRTICIIVFYVEMVRLHIVCRSQRPLDDLNFVVDEGLDLEAAIKSNLEKLGADESKTVNENTAFIIADSSEYWASYFWAIFTRRFIKCDYYSVFFYFFSIRSQWP